MTKSRRTGRGSKPAASVGQAEIDGAMAAVTAAGDDAARAKAQEHLDELRAKAAASSKTLTFIAKETIRHNGERYEPGDRIELDEASFRQLAEVGAVAVDEDDD